MSVAETEEESADALRAVVGCLRHGSGVAARHAAAFLAPDVVLSVAGPKGTEEVRGRDAVLERLTGEWPNGAIYRQLSCSDPYRDGEIWKVDVALPAVGYLPHESAVEFSFGEQRLVSRISRRAFVRPAPIVTATIPLFLRGLIDGALANGTPLTFSYIDLAGMPSLSLRASTQVYDDVSISVWLRSATGGASEAIPVNPAVGFLYRDERTRTTLSIQGTAQIVSTEAVRERVYWSIPEVEQRHDPERCGAALLVDVRRITGTSLEGPIEMRREP